MIPTPGLPAFQPHFQLPVYMQRVTFDPFCCDNANSILAALGVPGRPRDDDKRNGSIFPLSDECSKPRISLCKDWEDVKNIEYLERVGPMLISKFGDLSSLSSEMQSSVPAKKIELTKQRFCHCRPLLFM